MKKEKLLLSVIIVLISALQIYSQVAQQWVTRYNGPVNGPDEVFSMAVDSLGNVYITGRSVGIIAGTNFDYATIKYNSLGIQEWVQRYSGLEYGSDQSHSITVDRPGNVYVTGSSDDISGHDTTLDFVTIKYSSTGDLKWLQRYNGPGNYQDVASSVGVDDSGNVYVTGFGHIIGNNIDYITIKYNIFGVLQWAKTYEGTGTAGDYAIYLKVDGSGNVYVTGNSWGAGTLEDYVTIKYNSSGVQQWVQRYDGTGHEHDNVFSLALDNSGNVYVTGRSWGGDDIGLEYATVKYNSSGVQQWARRYSEPAIYADVANSVAVDNSGNVYVTGQSNAKGNYDYATVKYNSSGVQQWVRRYNGTGNGTDIATSVTFDGSENVYVTGYSYSSGTDYDYVTIKYNQSGVQQWIKNYNGTANLDDISGLIAVDGLGNIYVTGKSAGVGTAYDYTTVKYTQPRSLYLTSLVQGLYNSSTKKMISDTMRVYLRNINSPFAVVDSSISVLDSSGNGSFHFSNAVNGIAYYILLKHRNSIETWSKFPGQSFSNSILIYNFSDSLSKAFGNNMVQTGSSPQRYAIYSGDVNQNGIIDINDVLQIYGDGINFVKGYQVTDVNGDMVTDIIDILMAYNNSVRFVSVIQP